jgi:hypothetical protein
MAVRLNTNRSEFSAPSLPVKLAYSITDRGDDEGLEPQVVKIQSQNRTSLNVNYSSSNGQVNVFTNANINRARRVAVKRVSFMASLPNITEFNNRFTFNAGSSSEIVIAPGLYGSPATVNAAIVAAVAVAFPPSLAFTITAVAGSIRFIWSAAFPFSITHPANIGQSIFNSGVFGIGCANGGLGTVSNKSLSYTLVNRFMPCSRLNIVSNVLAQDTKMMNGGFNSSASTLMSIPIKIASESFTSYEPAEPLHWINIDKRSISTFDISIEPDAQFNWTQPNTNTVSVPVIVAEFELTFES